MKTTILTISLVVFAIGVIEAKFPKGFSFGASTSALQTEGAWLKDGKSLTVWDNLARVMGYVSDKTSTENTCNSYYMYDQDIALMKQYGIKHYRLSIQWARILPYAKANSTVNQKAVKHYRRVLKLLKEQGIESYVNLYHNDMPAALHFGGFGRMDESFPQHFAYYADRCFELFGDLVKYWFTFDEPWCQSAQGRYEKHERNTKPYMIGHQMLLAHAEAVKVYREKYQAKQGGYIGVNLNGEMFWPFDSESEADKEAAIRNLMFQVGWFWHPIATGDYPEVMKQRVGDRLPKFTPEQSAKIKGAADFFALNHYSSWVVKDGGHNNQNDYEDDVNSTNSYRPEWKKSDINFSIVPQGMHDLLVFIHETWLKDTSLPVFITENGLSAPEDTIQKALSDSERIDFLSSYLREMERAINEGVNVKKYFVWTLIDNFEWSHGLTTRFGLTRVEYKDGYTRIPKDSLRWYSEIIKNSE